MLKQNNKSWAKADKNLLLKHTQKNNRRIVKKKNLKVFFVLLYMEQSFKLGVSQETPKQCQKIFQIHYYLLNWEDSVHVQVNYLLIHSKKTSQYQCAILVTYKQLKIQSCKRPTTLGPIWNPKI